MEAWGLDAGNACTFSGRPLSLACSLSDTERSTVRTDWASPCCAFPQPPPVLQAMAFLVECNFVTVVLRWQREKSN
jgi:hypothetical protein